MHVRLAITLRVLAGGSYLDAAITFGVGIATTYAMIWQVIDSVNKTGAVGPFFFPQTEADCRRSADGFKVCFMLAQTTAGLAA